MATAVDRGRKPRVQGLAGEIDSRSAPGAVHGDEVAGPLVGDAELSQLRLAEGGLPSCPTDELRPAHADAGHAQKGLQRRAVHLHGKEVQVVQSPVRLRIDIGGEEGVLLVDDLAHVEAVEAQEPVGLVEAVLAVQLHGVGGGQERIGHDGEVGAEEHALQRQVGVQGRRQVQDLVVAFRGGSDDHLGGLARRREGPCLPGVLLRQVYRSALLRQRARFRIVGDGVADMPHGGQDGRTRLVGGQKPQALPARQLQIHRETVGQAPQLVDELHRGAGDGLGVDVAAKAVLLPQDAQGLDHEFGGAIGASGDARGEEQPLDVVATVEANGEVGQLARRKCGSGCLGVARAVHAVAAIVDADVGHEHLEQRDAAPVRRERMAASRLGGRAQLSGLARALNPGGGASHVVLRRIGQNLQLLDDVHRATPSNRQP